MPDILDDVGFANRCLVRFGAGTITSFEDATDLADICRLTIPEVIRTCFDAQDWLFARGTRQLERVAWTPDDPPPPNGWRYGYNFPVDAVRGPHRVSTEFSCGAPMREFAIEARRLFTNCETVYGLFTLNVEPARWPASFLEFATIAGAAALAVPVTHDTDLAAQLDALAWGTAREGRRGGLCGKAYDVDTKTHPGFAASGDNDPLTQAHYGGGPLSGTWHGDSSW